MGLAEEGLFEFGDLLSCVFLESRHKGRNVRVHDVVFDITGQTWAGIHGNMSGMRRVLAHETLESSSCRTITSTTNSRMALGINRHGLFGKLYQNQHPDRNMILVMIDRLMKMT